MEQIQDLFETPELIPQKVQEVLDTFTEDYTYQEMERLLVELKPLGHTFDYGLDAEPYDLREILN